MSKISCVVKPLILLSVFLGPATIFAGPTQVGAISVSADENIWDGRLTVQPNLRPITDWCKTGKPENICGPIVLVTRPEGYWSEDDLPIGTSSLFRGNEKVMLAWDGMDIAHGPSRSAANDPENMSMRTESYTLADLPFGIYRYDWRVETSSSWSCSKYNPDGCSFGGEDSFSETYYFKWEGKATIVYPSKTAKVRVGRSANAKNVITASKLGVTPEATPKVVPSKSSVCKVTSSRGVGIVQGLKKGTCKIRIRYAFDNGETQLVNFKMNVV